MSPTAKPGRTKLDAATAKALKERVSSVLDSKAFESRRNAAGRLGVDVRTVEAWCSKTGKQVPDFPLLVKLCRLTGYSLNWLVLGVGAARTNDDVAGSIEDALARYVAGQIEQRRGLSRPPTEDDLEDETETGSVSPFVVVDGARLLEHCVEQALRSLDESMKVLHARAMILRAAEELAGVGEFVPSLVPGLQGRAGDAVRVETESLARALRAALPEPDGATPVARYADTPEAFALLDAQLRQVSRGGRRKVSVLPEIRRTLEAVHFEQTGARQPTVASSTERRRRK